MLEKTGQLTKSQTSYLNKEVLWGHKFSNCLEYSEEDSKYIINPKLLNATVPCVMSNYSPRETTVVEEKFAVAKKLTDEVQGNKKYTLDLIPKSVIKYLIF